MDDDLGIPDRESWLLRSMYPSGKARGWRRQGCIAVLVAAALACLAAVVIVLAVGGDEDTNDEPCDQLAIRAAYLEAIEELPPAAQAELVDIDAQLDDLGC